VNIPTEAVTRVLLHGMEPAWVRFGREQVAIPVTVESNRGFNAGWRACREAIFMAADHANGEHPSPDVNPTCIDCHPELLRP
jgi:hypothetical protein